MNTAVKRVSILLATIAIPWVSIGSQVFAQGCQFVETRQSYSYQLVAFRVGDKAVVSVDEAKLMAGTETRAVLNKRQSFEVRDIAGPWLGSEIEKDGRKIKGWVLSNHVTRAGEPSAQIADRAAVARPGTERRSFSYEPSERRSFSCEPSYRSSPRYRAESGHRKAPWEYPKTDPRRYRP